MRRMQNILLLLWSILLVLLFLSNWSAVWKSGEVGFLFLSFQAPLLAWIFLGALLLPWIVWFLGGIEAGSLRKNSEHQINRLKSEAYDAKGLDPDRIVEPLRQRLESMVDELIERKLGPPSGAQDPSRDSPAEG